MELAVLVVGVFLIVSLWMRVNDLQREIDHDHRYFEWWMRSMENRKQDKPEVEAEESILDEEEQP